MAIYGLQQVFEESVSAVTATPSVQLGTERWEGGRKYIYMYNKSTSTASTKFGVVYSASSGYSMTISSVVGEQLAGVVVNADIPTVNYGWVCVKGHVAVTSDTATAPVAGGKLICGDLGYMTMPSGGTSWTGMVAGVVTAGTAATATFAAFINVG